MHKMFVASHREAREVQLLIRERFRTHTSRRPQPEKHMSFCQ